MSDPTAAVPQRIVRRLFQWWRPRSAEEEYLAAATDHADLERRARVLERDAPSRHGGRKS